MLKNTNLLFHKIHLLDVTCGYQDLSLSSLVTPLFNPKFVMLWLLTSVIIICYAWDEDKLKEILLVEEVDAM